MERKITNDEVVKVVGDYRISKAYCVVGDMIYFKLENVQKYKSNANYIQGYMIIDNRTNWSPENARSFFTSIEKAKEYIKNKLGVSDNSEDFIDERIENLNNVIKENLYQIQTPNFGDTDCGSERIVNAVVNITMEAFKLSLEESRITEKDRRYFCNSDLARSASDEIIQQMNNHIRSLI